MGLLGLIQTRIEEAQSQVSVDRDDLALLESGAAEAYALRRELDMLGYSVLDYLSGASHELKPETRRNWAHKARVVWMSDPMAGAAVDLVNDFVFGRGVPRPTAKDKAVQEILDEFWDDPDNRVTLTTYDAQRALGTDLELQSNIFIAVFDDGDDGKVKTAIVKHDSIEGTVPDPNNDARICYFVAGEPREMRWDFDVDQLLPVEMDKAQPVETALLRKVYYEHFGLRDTQEENAKARKRGGRPLPKPPKQKLKPGRVYHICVNRTTEMKFGVPTMQRTLRWYNAFNEFMSARVDMAKAVAALMMRRKTEGTKGQVEKMAQQAMSRRSVLGAELVQAPPATGSVITENESVTHEQIKMDSGAANAAQDALLLRGQISASTRMPQHYLGDHGNANLATATSMELPVAKHVEARQELFEQLYRALLDLAIDRAVETGRLSKDLTPEERRARGEQSDTQAGTEGEALGEAADPQDEAETGRDLSYEFSMPNPLRRLMTDLVSAVSNIAKTFDPNNTNVELSRALLKIVLGEGLEVQDASAMVDSILPAGYVDPAVAQAAGASAGFQFFQAEEGLGPTDDQGLPAPEGMEIGGGGGNDPFAPKSAKPGEEQERTRQSVLVTSGRDGQPVHWLVEAAALPDGVRQTVGRRQQEQDAEFQAVLRAAERLLSSRDGLIAANGSGNGHR